MSPNPFFSGRIPQELYDRAEEYVSQTGKPKTQILIEALATYLEFPVDDLKDFKRGVSRSEFEVLERRVKNLERSISSVPSGTQLKLIDSTILSQEDRAINQPAKQNSSLTKSSPVTPLRTPDLARRFNMSPNTIHSMKSRCKKNTNKFSQWLKSKDPDSISWEYRRQTKMYHPVIE